MSPGVHLVQQPMASTVVLALEPTNNIIITEDTQTNSMVS